jgi:ribulose-5-phosphate 4-epimerase/fuculose-1-phosphate aldolase
MATAIRKSEQRIDCSPEEWEARVNLAACYRAVYAMGWNKSIIYNHITLRVPGTEHFLINPFGMMYSEITASNLIKIDWDGNKIDESAWPVLKQGFVVHSAVHRVRDDINCVIHTHSANGVAVACQAEGLIPLSLESMAFTDRIAYYDVQGVTDDTSEREAMAAALGDKRMMILRNHGLLVCGSSVAEAFHDISALELACEYQVNALAGGVALSHPPIEVARKSAQQIEKNSAGMAGAAMAHWAAVRRWMERIDPSFAT